MPPAAGALWPQTPIVSEALDAEAVPHKWGLGPRPQPPEAILSYRPRNQSITSATGTTSAYFSCRSVKFAQ
jgi:hypothetical protein